MKKRSWKTWALAALLLAASLLSAWVVTPWAASAETHAKSITALEEKQTTVLELAAASTTASAAKAEHGAVRTFKQQCDKRRYALNNNTHCADNAANEKRGRHNKAFICPETFFERR